MPLNCDPVLRMQPCEVKVHELARIEPVLVRVERYEAAELNFKIPATPLEPLPPGCRIRLLPVPMCSKTLAIGCVIPYSGYRTSSRNLVQTLCFIPVYVLRHGSKRIPPSGHVTQDDDVYCGHPEEVVVGVVMSGWQLQEVPVQIRVAHDH